MTRKAVLSWSSGKDAAMALHVARTQGALDIVALVSNFNAADDRVKTHGSQRDIVRAQAALDLAGSGAADEDIGPLEEKVSANPDRGRASTQPRVPRQNGKAEVTMSCIVPRGMTA